MASSIDYFIYGDHAEGRRFIGGTLEAAGFAVTPTPHDGLLAKRGSTAMTVLFGALAGSKFQIALTVDFMVDAAGLLVARLESPVSMGLLSGGVLGASKTEVAFRDTANFLAAGLGEHGILACTLPH